MGLISEVKCGRCDRRYSGLRARCPYCGARRGKRGKHAKDYDNSKGRFIIGLILVVVLIVAVITVIATSMTEAQKDAAGEDQQQTEQGGNIADSDSTTNVEGAGAGNETDGGETGTEGETGTDSGTDTGADTGTDGETDAGVVGEGAVVGTAINNLYIVAPWSDSPQTDFTAAVGDVIDFDYVSEPELEDAEVLWETSDDNVFVVLQTGEFTAIGEGSATLSLTVNDKKIELQVIVN